MDDGLFDSQFILGLNALRFAIRVRPVSGLSGGRRSLAFGSSAEFSDFREYIPGDDIRRIDWNAYGRTDRLYIKQFMEEKEAVFNIFVDTSRSMEFGEPSKLYTAKRAAGAFSYIALSGSDRVCVCGAGDGGLRVGRSVSGKHSFAGILDELSDMSASGGTSLLESVRRRGVARGGVSIIISDFLDRDSLDEMAGYLAYMKQQIVLIHVLAREELEIELDGTVNIVDMEDGDKIRITMSGASVRAYRAACRAHEDHLRRLAKNIRHRMSD